MEKTFETINYSVNGGICRIVMNRPDVYNAFNDEMSYEMQDALKMASKDKAVRVVILSGEGKAFSSGQDLKAISGTANRSLSESLYKRYNPIIKAIRTMSKPVICRLNGVAAGAGCSLALACDYIVAVDTATMVLAFVNIGLVPDSGASYFLPKAIGYARSFEMATRAPKVSAQQALEWGMVNRVVQAEQLDATVDEAAQFYANAPTKAIGMIKKMLNKGMNQDLEAMLQYEAYCQEIAGRSADYKEGVAAFIEKRKAVFKGE